MIINDKITTMELKTIFIKEKLFRKE